MSTKTRKKIERLTAAQCTAELGRVERRQREIAARIETIRPPSDVPTALDAERARRDEYDSLRGAGEEYRAAALDGDPEDLLELIREHETLGSEQIQLFHRADALERRKRAAEEEEAKAAAPGELKKLTAAADQTIERAERALADARAALAACGEWMREVERVQEVLETEGGVLSPVQFRRLGLVLRHRVEETTEHELINYMSMVGRSAFRPALFRTRTDALRAARSLLPAADSGLLERVRSVLGRGSREAEELERWNERRLDLIASGEVEEAAELTPPPAA